MSATGVNVFSKIMMKMSSSISASNAFVLAKSASDGFGDVIITFLCRAIYTICKWIMYFLDIIFFYIRQISGMNTDTSSLEALTSGESDMVFKLLTSNSNLVTQIIRQLVGLAIIVIIVLTIISLIKTQYQALRDNKPGDNKKVILDGLKSLLLIVITPAIAIGGIMLSNILLKSLYNATNVTGATSLGSSIFSLSSTSANMYRLYGQSGDRIPIYFEFSTNESYLDQIEQGELTQKSIDYLTSKDNPAYQAHLMFDDESFYTFLELTDSENKKDYYVHYDKPADAYLTEYQKIRSEREEYLIMADFVDYAVKTSGVFYFKTIEEVLDAAKTVPNNYYSELKSIYDITETPELITFTNNIYSYDELSMQAGSASQIQYNHVKGELDELYGAVFVVTTEKTVEISGTTYTYYEPLVNGYRKDSNAGKFDAEYLKDGSMVVAKGLFTSDGLPTAIKRDRNGTDVQFYRDTLVEYDLGDVAGLAQLFQESEQQPGFFSAIVKFFKAIFNPESLVPKFELDTDAVKITYRKETGQVAALENGRMHVSYLFNKSDSFKTSVYTINVDNFFNVRKFNLLILVMGSWLLLKVCLTVVFALIKRIYDLFLLFIFYPAACAPMPIDNGEGYKKWTTKFVGRLFATYGLILGINFVLMVVPIAETIEFFTPADIATSTVIRRIGALFFNFYSYNQVAKAMNLVVAVLFELVAFSMLEGSGVVKLMSSLFPGEEDITTDNPAPQMAKVATDMANVVTKGVKAVTGVAGFLPNIIIPSRRKELVKKTKSKLERITPGSAVYNEVQDMRYRHDKKRKQKGALKDLKEVLDSASSGKGDVEKALNNFMKAQESYTKTLASGDGKGSTRGQREAERDHKKEDEKKHIMQNSRAGDDKGGSSGDGGMFDGYSDNEIEKLMKDAEKFEKKNSKKYEKGKLDDVQSEKYEEAQKILSNGQSALENRKNRQTEILDAQSRIADLQNKKATGTPLTPEEAKEIEDLEAKIENHNNQMAREQEAYKLRHNKRYRKKYEREQAKKANDAKVFRHQAKGKWKRLQQKRLKEMDADISAAEDALAENGLADKFAGKSIQEIDEAIEKGNLTGAQREMVENYKSALSKKENALKINDNEYSQAAELNATNRAKKDDNVLASKGIGSDKRRERRDKAVNKGIEAYQQELKTIQSKLDSQSTSSITADTYAERRKLNERKLFLEQKIAESEKWNQSNNEENITKLREDKKKQKKFSRVDKYTNLTEHAINYLQANNKPLTQENIDAYINNALKARNAKYNKKED